MLSSRRLIAASARLGRARGDIVVVDSDWSKFRISSLLWRISFDNWLCPRVTNWNWSSNSFDRACLLSFNVDMSPFSFSISVWRFRSLKSSAVEPTEVLPTFTNFPSSSSSLFDES